jgi:hypothetical protein
MAHKGNGERRGSAAILVACGLACLLPPAVDAAEPDLRVVVAILNYAGVPRETMDLAEAQASTIFEKAGVTIEWREPHGSESANINPPAVMPSFFVKLLPDSMFPPVRPSPGAFGSALGIQAYVFAGRIRQATEEGLISFPRTLGHIMAHELGHVLLGEKSHAFGSIMTPKLGAQEFREMYTGTLLFTPAQAKRMRDRIRTQQAAETAVLLAQK